MTRLYRALLYLYPSSWRAEYGEEMCAIFAARQRETHSSLATVVLWLEVLPDLLTNAVEVQWDVLRQDLRQAVRTGENLLGRRINIGNQDRIVIGIVGDIRVRGLERSSEPQVYVSWQQPDDVSTWYAPKDLVARTTGDPVALVSSLRRIIREADPTQPISEVRTMTSIVEEQTAPRRAQLAVLGSFGVVATLLAAVGIYGMLAFAVSSRTQEIGVRMALGAQHKEVFGMIIGEGFQLAVIGVVVDIALASGTGQLLQSLLAGVKPWDPGTLTVAIILSLAMTVAGSLLPAIRAVRVNPVIAMRAE